MVSGKVGSRSRRTNARGLCCSAVLPRILLALSLAFIGCNRGDASAPEPEPSSPDAARECGVEPTPSAEPKAGTWGAGLQAALARAVVAPTSDDGTYRVDPFVAALVFEEFTATGGKGLVEPWSSDGAEGKPKSGYRVLSPEKAPLLGALGLQEGDVIEALNGVVLSDPDRVGFALDGAENRVTLMVFRDGYSFTMSYRLAAGLAWRDVLLGYSGEADPVVAAADARPVAGAAVGESADTKPPSPSSKPGSTTRPKTTPSARPSGSKPSGSKPSSAGSIRCQSSTRCTIDKATYLDMVASPKKLQSQVKVVPAIKNNVHSGYKIKSIRSGSPASKLGFRSGDKITHVNGRDLTDEMQALQLYWSLGSARLFKVRFERGGSRRVKTIAIQ